MTRRGTDDCRECFMRGCDCECKTCMDARSRNIGLSNEELLRLSMEAGLRESGVSEAEKRRVSKLLEDRGIL